MAIVTGDNHLGIGYRNKVYYRKAFYNFRYILNSPEIEGEDLIIAGDLFEYAQPSPNDYIEAKEILSNCKAKNIFVIPGNHDKILPENDACAAKVLEEKMKDDKRIIAVDKPLEYGNFLMVPYSYNMFDYIRDYDGPCKILVSHFSTFENHAFAGSISENDEMFNKFDLVIIGDTHDNIDKEKFVTSGATFYRDVDEMLRVVPAFVKVDGATAKYKRITFPELTVTKINDFVEAIDDDKLYVIVTNELTDKNNIFVKRPKNKNSKNNSNITEEIEKIDIHNNFIGIDYLIDNVLKDKESSLKEKIKQFIRGDIDIDRLIEYREE